MNSQKIFLLILALLIFASIVTALHTGERDRDGVAISWATDPNEQRYDQRDIFYQWQLANGIVDEAGKPKIRLHLDTATNQSMLIQLVSGVGSDVFDVYGIRTYQPFGVMQPFTEEAKRNGFSLADTYPGLEDELMAGGEQYAYPFNVANISFWINVDAFERVGMAPPGLEWTPEEFERIGAEFVIRANAGKKRQEVFFTNAAVPNMQLDVIARSKGVDRYNETLTAATLTDPWHVAALEMLKRWTYEDVWSFRDAEGEPLDFDRLVPGYRPEIPLRLSPSPSDVQSMSSSSGYGGNDLSQFCIGNYATVYFGRHLLIRLRGLPEEERPRLAIAQHPMYEFPNTIIYSRAAGLYKGGRNQEAAKTFLKYIASREYNEYILLGGDGLPSNPAYSLADPNFGHPERFPNEGDTTRQSTIWAKEVGFIQPVSPYIKGVTIDWMKTAYEKYCNDRSPSALAALAEAEERYARDIQTNIAANPELKKQYEADVELQKRVDDYKAAGKKLPAAWIKNSFLKAYYRAKGMLQE
ncbi:ABC transporter substrate-binding protein [Victivallis sp. Marseille-Q1083]|uniref:ABC transporter substrate-binding protein n=1 Tax=Victivallis sp. Marseille-Q1083 TaxID=2717288 RepID=UPI001588C9C5|nr:extracellular solute-binding protein [Victivallis sp. Marseille-Q1083]